MNNEELYDKIEAYLKGRLSEEERAAVEREIQTNPEAALEFQLQQVEMEAMEAMLERDLRGKIHQWLEEDEPLPPPENDTPTPSNTSRPGRLWIAALLGAVVVLAIIIRQVIWPGHPDSTPPIKPVTDSLEIPRDSVGKDSISIPPRDSTPLPPEIRPAPQSPPAGAMMAYAGKLYEDLDLDNTKKGAPMEEDEDPLSEAVNAYKKKQYRQALQLLNTVSEGSSYATRALEMKAHALYHLKKYKESAAAFATVAATKYPQFVERAQWNQLVCYTAQYPATKAAFDELLAVLIADTGHAYHERALELQKRLSE